VSWLTATQSLSALQKGEIGSRELLDRLIARIERHNPAVNAVVVQDYERARARADAADAARARGQSWGPLHGLPMTVKECFDVEGLPTTAGAPALRANRAVRHADAVRRLVDAGAVIFGKTNTPLFAGDLQTYNSVYGTTHNPWDLACGPGGSSGGAAAALAAGMTPLELGSDIGGSIRNPAHFCGVYGHKPSFGIVPMRGHVPGPPNTLSTADIGVGGPMARSVEDLQLGLAVLAGPGEWDAAAWRLELPSPRQTTLNGYRIAVCADHAFCPVDREIADAIERAAAALGQGGAKVGMATPEIDFAEAFRVYYRLLAGALSPGLPAPQSEAMAVRAAKASPDDQDLAVLFARGATRRHAEHLRDVEHRQQQRARWADFFRDWDAFLCPVILTAAFPHDQSSDMGARRLVVNGVERPYFEAICWAGLIGNVRLPSTVVPIGRTKAGLPIGMQVVGPYLEDRTALDIARHVERAVGGFVPPPAFA
jgi:amidase